MSAIPVHGGARKEMIRRFFDVKRPAPLARAYG